MTTKTFLTMNHMQTAPKPFNYTLLWVAAIVFSFMGGIMFTRTLESKDVRVDLPEEYQLIKATDNLQGKYDSVSNTLTIEFNNPKNK
jgi:hypothetical protein